MTGQDQDYFACPHCGADVPDSADFCRACGASEESGWEAEASWDESSEEGYVEEEDFDYDDYLRREFPEYAEPDVRPRPRQAFVVAIVLLLCLAFALMAVF